MKKKIAYVYEVVVFEDGTAEIKNKSSGNRNVSGRKENEFHKKDMVRSYSSYSPPNIS